MKLSIWFLLIIFFVCHCLQSGRTFIGRYSEESDLEPWGRAIYQTKDRSLLVSGNFVNSSIGTSFFAKISLNGDLVFWKNLGTVLNTYGNDQHKTGVLEASDGTYVVIVPSRGPLDGCVHLFKFNESGFVIWSKLLNGTAFSNVLCNGFADLVEIKESGDFLIFGSFVDTSGYFDMFFARLTSEGKLVWAKRFASSGGEEAGSILLTNDGNCFVVTGIYSTGGSGLLIAKFYHENGSVVWMRKYFPSYRVWRDVAETKEGDFVVTGATYMRPGGNSNNDIFVAKIRGSDGSMVWNSLIYHSSDNHHDSGWSIEAVDDGYVVTGFTGSFHNIGKDDLFLLKIQPDGTDLDYLRVYGNGKEQPHAMTSLNGGGYALTGLGMRWTSNKGLLVSVIGDEGNDCWITISPTLYDVDMTLPFTNETMNENDILDFPELKIYPAKNINVTDLKLGTQYLERCDKCMPSYYSFPECNITQCFGKWSNDSQMGSICNGTGTCMAYDYCRCDALSYGHECKGRYCFGIPGWNETFVCSGHGDCIRNNKCACFEGYSGRECELYGCFDYFPFNHSLACSQHGKCIAHDKCECYKNYSSCECHRWKCFGEWNNDTSQVCSGHGHCSSHDDCNCSVSYPGYSCNEWSCNSRAHDDPEACHGNGYCSDHDTCLCFPYYSSPESYCVDYFCNGIHHTYSSKVCSGGRGVCTSPDKCDCFEGYEGNYCETWLCFQDPKESSGVCSGHGTCSSPGKCDCDQGWVKQDCSYNRDLAITLGITLPLATILIAFCFSGVCLLLLILVTCVVWVVLLMLSIGGLYLFSQRKKIRRFSQLKNFDLHLKEQEMEEDQSIAHLRFKQKLFEVNFDDVSTIRILGEGGSNSIVFLAKWKGKEIAFKCFRTRNLLSTQDKFDEFEREVELMSSLNHPNIIQFFGASLNPPRVGILMEYCPNGELLEFVLQFREENMGMGYPFQEKLRLLKEVCSALDFIHSKNIIHRDLKCENVLISKDQQSKLMDFGLSKLVDRMSVEKTKRIGTSVYMAPELVKSDVGYNEKCDVFSFSVMSFMLLMEDPNPYSMEDQFQIEFRVANDSNFRPDIEALKKIIGEENVWICDILETCWSEDPNERFSCAQIHELFEKKDLRVDSTTTTKNIIMSHSVHGDVLKGIGVKDVYKFEEVEQLILENERLKSEIMDLKSINNTQKVLD